MTATSPDGSAPGWATSLAGTWDRAWSCLQAGVTDPRRAARHPSLATTGPDGADARVVVLRAADREQTSLCVHTDLSSAKVRQIAVDPRATLLVWDAGEKLQLRLQVRVAVASGLEVEAAWVDVPEPARTNYGGRPPPGEPIRAPQAYRETVERERFAVLVCELRRLETLHLGDDLHCRALFDAADGFRGRWIAP